MKALIGARSNILLSLSFQTEPQDDTDFNFFTCIPLIVQDPIFRFSSSTTVPVV